MLDIRFLPIIVVLRRWILEMGERSKGKDKGKAKKSPKAAKVGKRPHELQQQAREALRPPA